MIFKYDQVSYYSEQEIIDAGIQAIYWYCDHVKGRWKEVEHIIAGDVSYGYWYSVSVSGRRYQPELEDIYINAYKNNSDSIWVKWYIEEFVRYGNI